MTIAVLSALCASVFFAMSSALQHRSTAGAIDLPSFRIGHIGAFALRTVRHPAWIAGLAADGAGAALHALALNQGPLTLVQPLLISGLVFALPLRHWLDHRQPRLTELLWGGALTAGLITFLVASAPATAATSPGETIPALIVGSLLGIGALTAIVVARLVGGNHAPALLGTAAGIAFAGTAALLKTVTGVVQHHPASLPTTWTVYALAAVSGIGLLLNQLAFQAGPLRMSLPAISTVDPIASLVIGIAVYDERLNGGAFAVTAESIGLLIVIVATLALARSGAEHLATDQRVRATQSADGLPRGCGRRRGRRL